MPVKSHPVVPSCWRRRASGGLCALSLGACSVFSPAPPPAPAPKPQAAPAPAPAPAPVPPPRELSTPIDPATPADQAARRLLAYDGRLRQMTPPELSAEIARLGAQASGSADPPAPPDAKLALALALAQQHNPGDLARAADLLGPLVQSTSPELQPWQPMARLLADRITEERRLEDQLDQQAAQRRDTQRALQQLTEKLEGLKAIERNMAARPAAAPPPPEAAPPKSPKSP